MKTARERSERHASMATAGSEVKDMRVWQQPGVKGKTCECGNSPGEKVQDGQAWDRKGETA